MVFELFFLVICFQLSIYTLEIQIAGPVDPNFGQFEAFQMVDRCVNIEIWCQK